MPAPTAYHQMPRPANTIHSVVELKKLKSRRALNNMQPTCLEAPIEIPESSSSKRRSPSKPYTRRRSRGADSASASLHPQCHPFDQLPWISALDEAPDFLNPWDIADLSQLSEPSSSSRTTGSGPVRRRKTSLRSSPFPSHPLSSPSPRETLYTSQSSSPSTMPSLCDTPSHPRSSATRPQTPPPRSPFNPSRVLFRHLMPVLSYSDSHHNGSNIEPCTNNGFLPAFQLR